MKRTLSRTLVGLLAAAGLVGASVNAQAATTTSNFTVTVNLTAACKITTPPADVTLAYTAFSASAVTAESTFAVQCSQGLSYTPSLAVTSGTLVGVNYTLDLLSGSSGTTAAAATTAGTTAETFRVRASAAADQAGVCGTSPAICSATSAAQTLTITY